MVSSVWIVGLVASASVVFAVPAAERSTSKWVVHDSRATPAESFVLAGAAPADKVIKLRINLSGNDIPGLENKLNTISNPKSATFRQWLTKEEVEAYSTPSDATTSAVTSWLSANGVETERITPAGDWLSISVPVSKAEELLNAKYNLYTHKASGNQAIRTLEYSLPKDVAQHINAIHPTTS